MVFSAISRVSSFEADDDTLIVDTDHSVGAGREKNCMLCCGTLNQIIDAVRSWMKAERGNIIQQIWFIKTEMEQCQSDILQSAFRLWDLFIRGGGRGCWQWKFVLYSGFAQSLKIWGKWDKLFKALKVCENWVVSVEVCDFVVFRKS